MPRQRIAKAVHYRDTTTGRMMVKAINTTNICHLEDDSAIPPTIPDIATGVYVRSPEKNGQFAPKTIVDCPPKPLHFHDDDGEDVLFGAHVSIGDAFREGENSDGKMMASIAGLCDHDLDVELFPAEQFTVSVHKNTTTDAKFRECWVCSPFLFEPSIGCEFLLDFREICVCDPVSPGCCDDNPPECAGDLGSPTWCCDAAMCNEMLKSLLNVNGFFGPLYVEPSMIHCAYPSEGSSGQQGFSCDSVGFHFDASVAFVTSEICDELGNCEGGEGAVVEAFNFCSGFYCEFNAGSRTWTIANGTLHVEVGIKFFAEDDDFIYGHPFFLWEFLSGPIEDVECDACDPGCINPIEQTHPPGTFTYTVTIDPRFEDEVIAIKKSGTDALTDPKTFCLGGNDPTFIGGIFALNDDELIQAVMGYPWPPLRARVCDSFDGSETEVGLDIPLDCTGTHCWRAKVIHDVCQGEGVTGGGGQAPPSDSGNFEFCEELVGTVTSDGFLIPCSAGEFDRTPHPPPFPPHPDVE